MSEEFFAYRDKSIELLSNLQYMYKGDFGFVKKVKHHIERN